MRRLFFSRILISSELNEKWGTLVNLRYQVLLFIIEVWHMIDFDRFSDIISDIRMNINSISWSFNKIVQLFRIFVRWKITVISSDLIVSKKKIVNIVRNGILYVWPGYSFVLFVISINFNLSNVSMLIVRLYS